MFNKEKFLASLERLDDVPCDLSGDEINSLVNLAKEGDSELEYSLSCAFALGFERNSAI